MAPAHASRLLMTGPYADTSTATSNYFKYAGVGQKWADLYVRAWCMCVCMDWWIGGEVVARCCTDGGRERETAVVVKQEGRKATCCQLFLFLSPFSFCLGVYVALTLSFSLFPSLSLFWDVCVGWSFLNTAFLIPLIWNICLCPTVSVCPSLVVQAL